MTQRDLDSEVAQATGEDLRLIRRRGFSIIDLEDERFDPEPDQLAPQAIDWDEIDRQRHQPQFDQPGGALRMTA